MAFDGKNDTLPVTAAESGPLPVTRSATRFAAILVQHSKKAPMMAFELALDGLSPLAQRALKNLPRTGDVPTIRAIGKQDARGFTFLFKVAAHELAQHELPAMLERWDMKYEAARVKAFPPPPPTTAPEPLRPRSPRRVKAQGEEGGSARETFVQDLSVINAAIAGYDAQVMAAAMVAGAQAQQGATDPLLEDDGDGDGDGDGEQVGQASHARAALDLGAGGEAGDHWWPDLAPLHICLSQQGAPAPGAVQWLDGDGEIWQGWVQVTLEASAAGTLKIKPQLLPVEVMELTAQQFQQARTIQQSVAARVKVSADALAQTIRAKTAALAAARRRTLAAQALEQASGALELLEALLVHLQLAHNLEQRIQQHALGMPGWAIEVARLLATGAQTYSDYLACADPQAAIEITDRWCAPLAPLQLTEQMGLFADPAALRLQRQLQHLVDLAKQWLALGRKGTPGDFARVLAVWTDIVRAGGTAQHAGEKKKRTRAPAGS